VAGQKIIINDMTKKNKNSKIKKIIELLKFSLSLNDEEIIKSTIESVIEMLEEEENK